MSRKNTSLSVRFFTLLCKKDVDFSVKVCYHYENVKNEVKNMKAVITVVGKDTLGIVAKVSTACFEYGANIVDITQKVMREYFTMILLVELESLNVSFSEFADKLAETGEGMGLEIKVMHEDIFNSMHRI